jgi:hypothetical protein
MAYWLLDAIASYFGSQEMIRASLRDTECREVAEEASNDPSPTLDYIAATWPRLQPHVREAIITLIDAASHVSVDGS